MYMLATLYMLVSHAYIRMKAKYLIFIVYVRASCVYACDVLVCIHTYVTNGLITDLAL